ncbi:MAG: D-alanine--D-alanine ligase [Bacteroidetes bacterium]|jgi:D-alanine-D-alanine ligase|nr:D-alanine--D-alanine ligase [Bacteroidota bacterium]MBT4400288.1 D-alanine--D-alanine ligase [Bacteroidota bacterium]MBT4411866.1 D-alanine--D-alanine ligase [Bacteroidota bacterium]MBT7466362.1 D-alanine--D-alanine ligase [Bacteroidota bacterium]
MSSKKKHIAIVAGGYSSEKDISLQSAHEVLKSLDREYYEPSLVEITSDGWFVKNGSPVGVPINRHDFSYMSNGNATHFDAVFNAIHGHPGENGILQAYFELLNIPFTGCSSFCSSVTFNKYACKSLIRQAGIPVARSILIRENERISTENILRQVGLPCFVKPNNGGSSCGISRVNEAGELVKAIGLALAEDNEVIIEEFIPGREITCGVVSTKKEFIAFPITEIISKKEFFDYEAKYTPGGADEITPANIPESLAINCQEKSKKIYTFLGCKGMVRVDYILSQDQLWFLEINTIPGLSEHSIVPQQIRALGRQTSEIFSALLDDIIES